MKTSHFKGIEKLIAPRLSSEDNYFEYMTKLAENAIVVGETFRDMVEAIDHLQGRREVIVEYLSKFKVLLYGVESSLNMDRDEKYIEAINAYIDEIGESDKLRGIEPDMIIIDEFEGMDF